MTLNVIRKSYQNLVVKISLYFRKFFKNKMVLLPTKATHSSPNYFDEEMIL